MKIFGLDFTSAPARRKPLVLAVGEFSDLGLEIEGFELFVDYASLTSFVNVAGPVVIGFDFPFSQAAKLVKDKNPIFQNLKWPVSWEGFVKRFSAMSRKEFEATLEKYKLNRDDKDKHHKRVVDKMTSAQSPQTLYGTPVGKMFYEGSKIFIEYGYSVVPVRMNSSQVVAVEAYPGVFARDYAKQQTYKAGKRKRDENEAALAREQARANVIKAMFQPSFEKVYGFQVYFGDSIREIAVKDDSGDSLDSLICAVQAAWAWTRRNDNFGLPGPDFIDPDVLAFEGWIMDPHCRA